MQQPNFGPQNVKILTFEFFNQFCPQQGYATAEPSLVSQKYQNFKFLVT